MKEKQDSQHHQKVPKVATNVLQCKQSHFGKPVHSVGGHIGNTTHSKKKKRYKSCKKCPPVALKSAYHTFKVNIST